VSRVRNRPAGLAGAGRSSLAGIPPRGEDAGVLRALHDAADRLIGLDTGGLPVISLYLAVPVDAHQRAAVTSEVNAALEPARQMATDAALSHEARMSLRHDVARIERAAAADLWTPPAVAVFACAGASLYEEVQLTRRVRNRLVIDRSPWLRPLLSLLDTARRAYVVVSDRAEARFFELTDGTIREVAGMRDRVMRKPDFGGWYGLTEHRIRNRADELAAEHFRRVVAVLDEHLRDRPDARLVLGGHADQLPVLAGHLTPYLRQRCAGTFTIDPHTATAHDVLAAAGAVIDEAQRRRQEDAVRAVLDRAGGTELVATGLEACLAAANAHAVHQLFVHDEATAPGAVCDGCGTLAATPGPCPLCGTPMREVPDVIEELVMAVIDAGGTAHHTITDTPLADHLVAAELRFPVPSG
jgi:peptide chain release factor subunit 1